MRTLSQRQQNAIWDVLSQAQLSPLPTRLSPADRGRVEDAVTKILAVGKDAGTAIYNCKRHGISCADCLRTEKRTCTVQSV